MMNCKGQARCLFAWQINIHSRHKKKKNLVQSKKSFLAFRQAMNNSFTMRIHSVYLSIQFSKDIINVRVTFVAV